MKLQPPKRTLRVLPQAVTEDASTRSLPSILIGHFNVEVEVNQVHANSVANITHAAKVLAHVLTTADKAVAP